MKKACLITSLVLLVLTVGMWTWSCFARIGVTYIGKSWTLGHEHAGSLMYISYSEHATYFSTGIRGWCVELPEGNQFTDGQYIGGTWWCWKNLRGGPGISVLYGVGLHHAYFAILFSIYPAICLRRWSKQRGGEGEGDAEEAQA